MYCLNPKKKGKKAFMSLKLDMSKVYDRVSWAFLEENLMKMGMDQKIVLLIMTYMKIVSFSILINGSHMIFILQGEGSDKGIFYPIIYFFFAQKA